MLWETSEGAEETRHGYRSSQPWTWSQKSSSELLQPDPQGSLRCVPTGTRNLISHILTSIMSTVIQGIRVKSPQYLLQHLTQFYTGERKQELSVVRNFAQGLGTQPRCIWHQNSSSFQHSIPSWNYFST